MNIQDAISKMSPQMLAQGLKQLSSTMTPEQLSQAEAAIKSMTKDDLNQQLKSLDANALLKELNNNPALTKQLAQNPELMSKLTQILKNK